MRASIQSISFENTGMVAESNAQKSLTFIANEYLLNGWPAESSDENQSVTRVYLEFKIEATSSDTTSESILTFWSIDIKKFVYFARIGGKVTIKQMRENNRGALSLNFLNPADAQLFLYASKKRLRERVIDSFLCL